MWDPIVFICFVLFLIKWKWMKNPICVFEGFCTGNILDNIQMDRWADSSYTVITTMHTLLWNKDVHFPLVAHPQQAVCSNRKGPTVSLAVWYGSWSWESCGFTIHHLDSFIWFFTKQVYNREIQMCNWSDTDFYKNTEKQTIYSIYGYH